MHVTSRAPSLLCLLLLGAATAAAQERKFTVMLAIPTKSVEGSFDDFASDLPNFGDIWDSYFDRTKPDVFSFAEYWDEISYGNVSVSGDVAGWVEVPWPVLPQGPALDLSDTTAPLDGENLPFMDLNGGGMQPFTGETINQTRQMYYIDNNGELPGTSTTPFPPEADVYPPGLVDFDVLGRPVWTPGERFLDLNGNGRYDALVETWLDGWGASTTDGQGNSIPDCTTADGVIDISEVGDFDEDGVWDTPEPFEDFLVIYEHTSGEWIKLDPSPNNADAASRAWAESYIRLNYPGNADALIARCGNGKYDGPDFWIEQGSSKLQQSNDTPWQPGVVTPHPADGANPWNFDAWWQAYWVDKQLAAGLTPSTPPAPPQWNEQIPNLLAFDPQNPQFQPSNFAGTDRSFSPNAGGANARVAQGASSDLLPPDPAEADPDDNGCIDPQALGGYPAATIGNGRRMDGSQYAAGLVLPDTEDRNNDGLPDFYDGPAEFDDLPSSRYHAQNDSGLGYGGDGLFGEVTSPRTTEYFGQDVGSGSPQSTPPDGNIEAAGPHAYNIHGSNGYDAGNQANLEFLTWRRSPLDAPLGLAHAGNTLYAVDAVRNELFSITTATGIEATSVGSLGLSGSVVAVAFDSDANVLRGVLAQGVGFGTTFTLVEIDPITGLGTLGPLINVPGDVRDITFDAANGRLVGLVETPNPVPDTPGVNTTLYEFGLDGSAIPLLSVGSPGSGALGLAHANGDEYFTIDRAFNVAARLNSATGQLAPLAPCAPALPYDIFGLSFDGTDLLGVGLSDNIIGINGDGAGVFLGALGFAAQRAQALSRDYNLDGLLDLGEVRLPGTENYAVDLHPGTPNDGGSSTEYPFNRRRLTEDTVEALDSATDFGLLTMQTANNVFVHGAVLLPAGLYADGLAAGGRSLFQLTHPSMDLPIQTRDNNTPILFSDFAATLGGTGETGELIDDFGVKLMAHQWLNVWEGYPDLYDYDVYQNGIENKPLGIWDIMSGGLVHPSPILKEFGQGDPRLGTDHAPWVETTNLLDVLSPCARVQVTLPDYAFAPTNSAYYYENPNNLGERFYFWRLTRQVPAGNAINFSRLLPGDGMMIMHTDFGQNSGGFSGNAESFPQQQRIGTHAAYNIVQADGQQDLEAGTSLGDAGDPWPGTAGAQVWNEDTDPSSRWWGQLRSGLEITDLNTQGDQSTVTFLWRPRLVPSLLWDDVSGEEAINSFTLGYEAFDFFGGTRIDLYYAKDNPDYAAATLLTPNRFKAGPGIETGTFDIDAESLNGDGTYYFCARLVPGPGIDGLFDPQASDAIPANSNAGRGSVEAITPDPNNALFESWTLVCVNDAIAGAEQWRVTGSLSGVEPNVATTGQIFQTTEGQVSFRIVTDSVNGDGADVNGFTLTDPDANFIASEFRDGDRVRLNGGSGALPGFYRISSVPSTTSLTLTRSGGDSGNAGDVRYTLHPYNAGTDGFAADRFTFITTGLTPFTAGVEISHDSSGDPDGDGDGVPDDIDNCPDDFNDDQADTDDDGVGDACDPCPTDTENDSDGDGICDSADICPGGDDNVDADGDLVPDFCDRCPGFDDSSDLDLDGAPDVCDTCPFTPNPNQADCDGDGFGDACDSLDRVVITAQPFGLIVCPGDVAVLDVDAIGTPPLTFRWYLDGVLLPDQTSSLLLINDLSLSDEGYYVCEVENVCGLSQSEPAALMVEPLFGDLNNDLVVDLTDLTLLLLDFGCESQCLGDADLDGDTDLSDLSLLLTEFGLMCD